MPHDTTPYFDAFSEEETHVIIRTLENAVFDREWKE